MEEGEVLGMVGESGCGKSVSSLALMRLLPANAQITSGKIYFQDQDLFQLSQKQMQKLRASQIAMIFQDPFTSLNPYLKISTQLLEVLEVHAHKRGRAAVRQCVELLERLGVPEAEARFFSYPHQLSGGLKQRMMIAMGLLMKPKLLICDEPTTALDVTIQAQILDLLKEINQKEGTAILMITHDLGVVAGLCDRVQVMYAGRIVEKASVEDLFYRTQHPYTHALLECLPKINARVGQALNPIEGQPPDLKNLGEFCAFSERCPSSQDRCLRERPMLEKGEIGGERACFFPVQDERGSRESASC